MNNKRSNSLNKRFCGCVICPLSSDPTVTDSNFGWCVWVDSSECS